MRKENAFQRRGRGLYHAHQYLGRQDSKFFDEQLAIDFFTTPGFYTDVQAPAALHGFLPVFSKPSPYRRLLEFHRERRSRPARQLHVHKLALKQESSFCQIENTQEMHLEQAV